MIRRGFILSVDDVFYNPFMKSRKQAESEPALAQGVLAQGASPWEREQGALRILRVRLTKRPNDQTNRPGGMREALGMMKKQHLPEVHLKSQLRNSDG